MKIAVLGTGAIGGLLGVHLSTTGATVTLVDQGDRARALRRSGLSVLRSDGTQLAARPVNIRDAAERQDPHDVVILAVKAHEIVSALPALQSMMHGESTIVTVQNGIPWWYFKGLPGMWSGRDLAAADPDGRIDKAIDPKRVVGCVAYPAAEVHSADVVRHVEGNRFTLGELDGSQSERVQQLARLLVASGLKAPVTQDIRAEVWLKSWGNLAFNPISALTRASMGEICRQPQTRQLAMDMMLEAQRIAEKLGVSFRVTLERRLQGAEQVGEHKTSMLQDLEAGRPLELDAIVGTVLEIARLVGVRAATIEHVYGLTRLLDRASAAYRVT